MILRIERPGGGVRRLCAWPRPHEMLTCTISNVASKGSPKTSETLDLSIEMTGHLPPRRGHTQCLLTPPPMSPEQGDSSFRVVTVRCSADDFLSGYAALRDSEIALCHRRPTEMGVEDARDIRFKPIWQPCDSAECWACAEEVAGSFVTGAEVDTSNLTVPISA